MTPRLQHPGDDLLQHAAFWLLFGLAVLSPIKLHAESDIPKDKEINFSYTYVASDTGSMRPAIWDGDTYRVWPPIVRPWVYDREHLLGKIVIRKNYYGYPFDLCHRIIAITPRGAVTQGDNNLFPDAGFMARDGSDYAGEVTVDIHQVHPPKQKLHSYQRQ